MALHQTQLSPTSENESYWPFRKPIGRVAFSPFTLGMVPIFPHFRLMGQSPAQLARLQVVWHYLFANDFKKQQSWTLKSHSGAKRSAEERLWRWPGYLCSGWNPVGELDTFPKWLVAIWYNAMVKLFPLLHLLSDVHRRISQLLYSVNFKTFLSI